MDVAVGVTGSRIVVSPRTPASCISEIAECRASCSLITGTPADEPGEYRLQIHVKSALGDVHGTRTVVLVK